MRTNYWSCSDFANWIRGSIQPEVESSEGWRTWKEMAQSKHPIRYWIAEEGLDYVQDFIMWPVDKLYDLKYWINNRYITRTHALTSNLKKGQWHEMDTRILHCLFDELVNYVEIEVASANFRWDEESRKKYNVPFWSTGWFRWRTYRNVEAAMDHFEWASNLRWSTNEMSEDNPEIGKMTPQAKAAIEVRELYNWWKNVYPNRPDPYEVSGWSAYCESRRGDLLGFLDDTGETEDDRKNVEKMLDIVNKLEQKYEREDERMMIRLIKIRHSLWT